MTKEEVLKLALYLATMHHTDNGYAELRAKVRSATKQALEPEQEPVATLLRQSKQNYERNFGPSAAADWIYSDLLELLNTAPPQRAWVDLTDEKIKTLYAALKDVERTKGFSSENWFQAGLVMGEALHDIKEKNT